MDFRIESTRGGVVESVHRVSVAVVDQAGHLVAASGDTGLVSFPRSAAKPFQAMPLVVDGAAERFGFGPRELALACASHSSEQPHGDLAEQMLARLGLNEQALACGPHPPLAAQLTDQAVRVPGILSPGWSNCSGKHAGMLALALHHGWPVTGYELQSHPVQERCLEAVAEWSGQQRETIPLAVDGCAAVCHGLSLAAMALAYARLGAADQPAARQIRDAMMAHPFLVAGTGRLCTDLMAAYPGLVLAKVGAEGFYGAALPTFGLGIALKVEDGDMRSARPALLGLLSRLIERGTMALPGGSWPAAVSHHAELPTINTRGAVTGVLRAAGSLHF